MAYQNYYGTYQPPAYGNIYQQQMQQIQQMNSMPNNTMPQMQIQNGGFVTVRSMQEAYNYPVAIGNSVTFKDETAPYIYVKTRGFSQLEEPIFERFKLVKEDGTNSTVQSPTSNENAQKVVNAEYAEKSEIAALWAEIKVLKGRIEELHGSSQITAEVKNNE